MTRISTTSYENLREALSVVTWYKKSFERLVKGLLRSQPELLARLSFSGTKRETANMEAYSWGVGEDESRDGLYCGFEGVVRATVISVQDTPGLEVRDDAFDEVADAVDGRVVSFIGVGEFTMGGFLHGGDHSQSDVALVPDMIVSIEGCEESGFLDGLCIMHTTRQGWGDPGELSGQGAGHLQVHSRCVVLA